jgi:glycosyltransferase involved in cell wall biosynthesis
LGNVEPRKNLKTLVQAWQQVAQDVRGVRLVIAGRKNFQADEILSYGEQLLGDKMLFLGSVSESEKWNLMNAADGFVFPSVYEGFGIPVVEAYSAGCPIVFSGTTSLPEISVTPDQMFDPHDSNSIAARLIWMLNGGPEVQRSVETGRTFAASLTWDNAAAGTVSVFERALS